MAGQSGDGIGGSFVGDGLVPVESAFGKHSRPELTLAFPETHRATAMGVNHFELLDRRKVYETLRGWLSAAGE